MLVKGPAPDSGVQDVPLSAPAAPAEGQFETRELPLVAPGAPAGGALGMPAAQPETGVATAVEQPANGLPPATAAGNYAVNFGAYGSEVDADAVIALQAAVRQVHVSPDVLAWITRLVRASRPGDSAPAAINQWVKWGAGPRAGQSLVLAAKARALLQGRFAATREDVQALVSPVMRHRLLLSFAAEAEQKSADDVVAALLQAVPFPG
ncbi:MAG: MoxR family ATPase [Stenotrophomonas sp.]